MPSTVATSTATYSVSLYADSRHVFFATGRHWVFYTDGTDGLFRSSTDGVNWSAATTWGAGLNTSTRFGLHWDGTYIHYAWATGAANEALVYRRGTPNSDGTITWGDEQTAVAAVSGTTYSFARLRVQSNGYVWIGYRNYDGTYYRPRVTVSGNNDGTWGNTPAGFPYVLSTTSSTGWRVGVYPCLTAVGDCVVVYSNDSATVRAKEWTGAAWGAEKATSSTLDYGGYTCGITIGDDVHLVFHEKTSLDIVHFIFDYSDNAWGAEVTVYAASATYSAPALVYDSVNAKLYCFWCSDPTDDHLFYKIYDIATTTWDAVQTDWVDETTDDCQDDCLNCFYSATSSMIGVAYQTKTVSPYNIRYAFLTIVTGWAHIAKVSGVSAAAIAKVNGVAVAAIAKVNGVAV